MKAQNQHKTKLYNRNIITELLIRKAPISRIELSKITGLSKMTITNIINELSDDGIIENAGSENTLHGRKPMALQLKKSSKIFPGIYISRNYLYAVAGDLCGNLLYEERIETPKTSRRIITSIYVLLDDIISIFGAEKIQAIGISSIGPLDYKNGIILNPPNFFEIENVEIKKFLEKKYNYPVYVDKDMNASALAEWLFGKAKNVSDYIYLGVTNGIGSAIISADKLYRGANGFCGEIGHISIDINGKKCNCGNVGCLELYASINNNDFSNLDVKCKYLASALITLINLFDPSVIYLGHDIARIGEKAAALLNKEISDKYISRSSKKINVELSKFGERSPIYGAFALAVCGYIGKF